MSEDREENNKDKPANPPESPTPLGPFAVLGSVFRAWFGVQTEKNRQRDFSTSDPAPFIVAGIIFVALMIGGVLIAVNMVLPAGK